MSSLIGVRELKNQASEIVRAVREQMTEYVITVHGDPTAILRPFTDDDRLRLKQLEVQTALADMELLAQEIGSAWKSPLSGVELVAEQRR